MPQEQMKHKLAAILSTDVKGYSRLMSEDEMATVHTLKSFREIMTDHIRQHNGRVVDTPGDNLLSEFPSVVEAVKCAVEIQQIILDKNAGVPPSRRMEFRMGINLGDVIEDDDRLYGDGVNIAARMEGLAEGGGICISGTAYDQVENKLALAYEYLGEQEVKNIAKPVRVYRVGPPSEVSAIVAPRAEAHVRRTKPYHFATIAVVLGLLLAGGGMAICYLALRTSPSFDLSAVQQTVRALPSKTSIAVLPFTNLSDDPAQDYFSDGITNDLITDLSKFHDLFVIASNTVFTYKGKAVNVTEIGQQLGVRYVLEGSIQKVAEQVRINAQLIDTTTGHHLWAERYDRNLLDLFSVQNEILQTIVRTLALEISAAERQRAMEKYTDNLTAYDFVLRGNEHMRRRTRAYNRQAQEMFEKAVDLDPHYSTAFAGLGETYYRAFMHGWTEFPKQSHDRAYELGQKSISVDAANEGAHGLLCLVYAALVQLDLAITQLQRAITLNPNVIRNYGTLGWVMLWSGKTDGAIELLETALRFDPHSSENPHFFSHLGLAYYLKGQYAEALKTLERGIIQTPEFPGLYIALAANYAQMGRSKDAAQAAATVLRLQPFFEIDSYGGAFRKPDDRARIIDGLQKAGLK
jgi:adenylate cyclase